MSQLGSKDYANEIRWLPTFNLLFMLFKAPSVCFFPLLLLETGERYIQLGAHCAMERL